MLPEFGVCLLLTVASQITQANFSILYLFFGGHYLFVSLKLFFSAHGVQHWQVRYQENAHDPGKDQIIYLKPYNQQVLSYTPNY